MGYWNLRSDTVGYPVEATQPGTMMLSGYSPSLMKFVLSGQMAAEEEVVDEETGEITLVSRQITPLEAFYKVMTDSGLDPVREIVSHSLEGLLSRSSGDEERKESEEEM